VLDLYNSEFHVLNEMPVYLYGAYGGTAFGVMNIHGNLDLAKCAGPGETEGHWDFTFRTLSQMYG